jgi:alpha-glucosidase
MLGDELLGAPVLVPGNNVINTTEITVYLPDDLWFNFYNGSFVQSRAGNLTLVVPFDDVMPMYIRAGKIVPIQNTTGVNRARLLNNTFELIVALSATTNQGQVKYSASGKILTINSYDDINIISNCTKGANCVGVINIELTQDGSNFTGSISIAGEMNNTNFEWIQIRSIAFYGLLTNSTSTYSTKYYRFPGDGINLNTPFTQGIKFTVEN